MNQLAIAEGNANSLGVIHQDSLHPGRRSQITTVALQSLHQGIHHSGTAPDGVIEAGLRLEPFAEQRRHCRCVGVPHRHAADQETEQINPMTQKLILQMTINQRTEGSREMPHRREVFQQAGAAFEQLGHRIQTRAQRQQRQSVGGCSDGT